MHELFSLTRGLRTAAATHGVEVSLTEWAALRVIFFFLFVWNLFKEIKGLKFGQRIMPRHFKQQTIGTRVQWDRPGAEHQWRRGRSSTFKYSLFCFLRDQNKSGQRAVFNRSSALGVFWMTLTLQRRSVLSDRRCKMNGDARHYGRHLSRHPEWAHIQYTDINQGAA